MTTRAPSERDIARLFASAREIDRFSLVIESAVRRSDPLNYRAVLDAIKENRAAIAALIALGWRPPEEG